MSVMLKKTPNTVMYRITFLRDLIHGSSCVTKSGKKPYFNIIRDKQRISGSSTTQSDAHSTNDVSLFALARV